MVDHDTATAVGGVDEAALTQVDPDVGDPRAVGVAEEDAVALLKLTPGDGCPLAILSR